MTKNLKTRAQMEIVGLAFVVVLISFGLLIYIIFQVTNTPPQTKKTFTESQKAANLLNTMLKTNTQCSGATITQLLQDCAENQLASSRIQCPDSDYPDSCSFSNVTIHYILMKTLAGWQNDYFLKACLWNTLSQQCIPDGSLFTLSSQQGECQGQKESSSQPIPTSSGILRIWLDICY